MLQQVSLTHDTDESDNDTTPTNTQGTAFIISEGYEWTLENTTLFRNKMSVCRNIPLFNKTALTHKMIIKEIIYLNRNYVHLRQIELRVGFVILDSKTKRVINVWRPCHNTEFYRSRGVFNVRRFRDFDINYAIQNIVENLFSKSSNIFAVILNVECLGTVIA